MVKPRTLAEQMERDLESVFFDSHTGHGVTASFNPRGEVAYYVEGILNATPSDVQAMAEFSVAPWTFTCRQASVRVARKGDEIIVNETRYLITHIEHDGTGVTVFGLSLDSNG